MNQLRGDRAVIESNDFAGSFVKYDLEAGQIDPAQKVLDRRLQFQPGKHAEFTLAVGPAGPIANPAGKLEPFAGCDEPIALSVGQTTDRRRTDGGRTTDRRRTDDG